MIVVGLGSNLTGEMFDSPRAVLAAALDAMPACGIIVKKLSRFYQSAPVPKSDQPWFVNAVAAVETGLSAKALLQALHGIEAGLGRKRRVRWEARIIDLDIITYHDQVMPSRQQWQQQKNDVSQRDLIIPHPRLDQRLFVLRPLRDICSDWVHPVTGENVSTLIKAVENTAEQSLQTII